LCTPVQNVGAYGRRSAKQSQTSAHLKRQSKQIVELAIRLAASAIEPASLTHRAGSLRCAGGDVRATSWGEAAIRYPDLKNFFSDRSDKPTLAEMRKA